MQFQLSKAKPKTSRAGQSAAESPATWHLHQPVIQGGAHRRRPQCLNLRHEPVQVLLSCRILDSARPCVNWCPVCTCGVHAAADSQCKGSCRMALSGGCCLNTRITQTLQQVNSNRISIVCFQRLTEKQDGS